VPKPAATSGERETPHKGISICPDRRRASICGSSAGFDEIPRPANPPLGNPTSAHQASAFRCGAALTDRSSATPAASTSGVVRACRSYPVMKFARK
jgi:hypothetical protein